MVTFRVFGAVSVCGADGRCREIRTTKQRILLATLLLRGNEWTAASRLISTLWSDQPPKSASGNLKTYVWRLRLLLDELAEGRRMQSRRGDYRLLVDPGEVDINQFEELVRRGQQAACDDRPGDARDLLSLALRLWHGEPFDGLPMAVAEPRTAQLHERLHSAREQLVQAQLTLDRADEALPLLRRMLAEQPLRERSWAQYISALVQTGRRAEAIAAYRQIYRLLGRELGLEPGPAIRSAYQDALSG